MDHRNAIGIRYGRGRGRRDRTGPVSKLEIQVASLVDQLY